MAKRHTYDVQCPQCKSHSKVRMRGKCEGTTVGVRCEECHYMFDKVITMTDRVFNVPPDRNTVHNPLLMEFGKALHETALSAFSSSELLNALVEKLKKEGYAPNISMGFEVSLVRTGGGEYKEPVPLVENGCIVPGVFSEQDQNELKDLRISLEGE